MSGFPDLMGRSPQVRPVGIPLRRNSVMVPLTAGPGATPAESR